MDAAVSAATGPVTTATCPSCGAERIAGAAFCEACAFEFDHAAAAATPVTAQPGEESPLDVGWTGPVVPPNGRSSGEAGTPESPSTEALQALPCGQCGEGHYLDGYCDHCGSKQPDPRDHFTEEPQPWVAGVCDVGRRHRRNEDAMALYADGTPLSFASLVVCDGVSNTTDSHIASLAAAHAAQATLQEPLARGVGTRPALVAAAAQRLGGAVEAAQLAVVQTTQQAGELAVDNPPSCTFVAVVIADGVAVVGNVGDSRAYWLPDSPGSPARQLSEDDSFAADQMSGGVPRKEAETSAGAHAITRWLGTDSPDDITPHTVDLDLAEDGWLLVCSDGLWNYCSEAQDLGRLVRETVERLGDGGLRPLTLAQALTDFANEAGGVDNITVALARVGTVALAERGDGPHSSDSTVSPTAARPTAARPDPASPTDAKDTP